MTITNHVGEDVTVHAAAVAKILPGVHVAAFACKLRKNWSRRQDVLVNYTTETIATLDTRLALRRRRHRRTCRARGGVRVSAR